MKIPSTLFLLTILGLTLTACAASGDLAGTSWNLTLINGQAIVPGSAPTLVFDREMVSGNGSCNNFGGDYKASGDRLTVGPLMTTLMACLDGGVSEQETAYMAALEAAATYKINDNQLLIFDAAGNEALSFTRQ